MRDRSVSSLAIAVVILVVLWSLAALAESATNPPPGFVEPETVSLTEVRAAGGPSFTSQRELVLSLLVLSFGLVVIVGEFVLLRRRRTVSVEDLTKVVAITIILVGTLMALTAGFSSEQIAPAMGLFGTVAGYLLGRQPRPDKGDGGGGAGGADA